MGAGASQLATPFDEFGKCKRAVAGARGGHGSSCALVCPTGTCVDARKLAKEFHEREYDFALDEKKIRYLLGPGSKNKALAQTIVQKFSRNGKL
jgi:hypothetical protein